MKRKRKSWWRISVVYTWSEADLKLFGNRTGFGFIPVFETEQEAKEAYPDGECVEMVRDEEATREWNARRKKGRRKEWADANKN